VTAAARAPDPAPSLGPPPPPGGRSTPGGAANARLRRLDETLGPASLALVRRVRGRRRLLWPPARVGLMKTVGLGDMVLVTAVARDVIAALPDSQVVIFTGPDNAEVARLLAGVEVVALPAAKPWAAVPMLRAQHLDALIDFGQWTRLEAMYTALSGARWTAGFATAGYSRHHAYDDPVEHSDRVSELGNFRSLVARMGIEPTTDPSFEFSDDELAPPTSDPYAVFHLWPGGFRSELREWPAESWRELARRFADRGYTVVLSGGPGDVARTQQFIDSSGDLAGQMVSIAGRYRIADVLQVLARAHCVVSVNTGLMHLAAALGVRTVALNGPTSAARWGPVGPNVVCVNSDLPRCGFLNLGFEYEGERTDCMRGISVDRVAIAALEVVGV
jgi:lipopolysaccharide heptosyltransferase III